MTRFSVIISGALLAVTSVFAEEESAVLKLTNDNFDESTSAVKYNLVKFYAPWCGHCKSMAPAYIEAANALKTSMPNVQLGEVDATEETALAEKYKVSGYPTLLWFVDGESSEYSGPRTSEGIQKWIEERMQPALAVVTADVAAEHVAGQTETSAVWVFSGDEKWKAVASEAAEKSQGASIGAMYFVEAGENSAVVHRGHKETVSYSGDFTDATAVTEWIKTARVPWFGQITEDNYEIYMDSAKKGMFWACFDPKDKAAQIEKYAAIFQKAAQDPKVDFPSVWLDSEEFEAHAREELGCKTFPTIVLQKGDLLGDYEETKIDKFIRSFSEKPEELTSDAILQFFKDIEEGKLEPVPEPDELDQLDDDEDEMPEDEMDEEEMDEKEDL